jgi:hypothetical protein
MAVAVLGESFAWSPVWWYGVMAQREVCKVTGVVVGSLSERRVLGERFARSPVWWHGSAISRREPCKVTNVAVAVLGESFAWSPVWWYGVMAQREVCKVTGVVVTGNTILGWYGSASARRESCKVTDVVRPSLLTRKSP